MRRLMLPAGLALALGALLPGSAGAAVGGGDLPFNGTVSGYGTINTQTGQAHVVYSGTITHLGLTTIEQDVQNVPTGPGTFHWFATQTQTAANGDEIFETGSGTFSFAADGMHATLAGQWVSKSGTGRFADASVSGEVTGQITVLSVEATTLNVFVEVTAAGTLSH